jgi:hypothetical protein
MTRELDIIAKTFSKTPVTVMRTELNLYQSNVQSAAYAFLKKIEQECKKRKQSKITLIVIIQK